METVFDNESNKLKLEYESLDSKFLPAVNIGKSMKYTYEEMASPLNISTSRRFGPRLHQTDTTTKKSYRICMVSDYFYPSVGGVESHIWALSCGLIEKGHSVVVITHIYEDYFGIKEFENGLRVYYLPLKPFYDNNTLPTIFGALSTVRRVLMKEQIHIVHGHSSFSSLAQEALLAGRLLGLKVVFTEHSLLFFKFGLGNISAIIINKLLEISLAACDQCICVSQAVKENLAQRGNINQSQISVIPNGLDSQRFRPDPSQRNSSKIIVVAISRLVYRKGIDLLAQIIPIVCSEHEEVQFLIGGDGPEMYVLKKMVESHSLQSRVSLLGTINTSDVQSVLVKGDIFLNTSLTEGFCMAVLEAAASGLYVVSTDVGGVSEILPDPLITLVAPTVKAIVSGLRNAIQIQGEELQQSLSEWNSKIHNEYCWKKVVDKTCITYEKILTMPKCSIRESFWRYYSFPNI